MLRSINNTQDFKPKISLIGLSGVGRSTLLNLIRTEEIPIKNVSSVNAEIGTLKVGKLVFYLWDYIGEEQFSFLWEEFIKDSDVVLLVLDSTLENVEKSKFFLEIIKKQIPQAHGVAICNKQDLKNTISISEVEKILGLKTCSMIATDTMNREKLIKIIINLLNMSDDVSHQLELINERNNLKDELEQVLNEDNFDKALKIIKSIVDICFELEDKILGKEFQGMAQQILKKKTQIETLPLLSNGSTITQQAEPKQLTLKQQLLKTLIKNYMNDIKSIIEVSIRNREGFIITSESRKKSEIKSANGAIYEKIPEISNNVGQIEKKQVRVICPTCKKEKRINFPTSIVKKASTIITFSIPKQLICEHQFQVFLDKNFAVRGYQEVHYEIEGYMERIIKEYGTESNFFNIGMMKNHKFAYCSMGPNSILMTIAEQSTSDKELRVFSEHVATKVELILKGNENVDVEIPQIIKTISKTKGGKLPRGEFIAKIIMTGDYQVGKTSIINRFVTNLFAESHHATIGVDISRKSVELGDETSVIFIIWDIGGQIAKMTPHRKKFYEGATSGFIVFDRTRPETLKNVEIWYNDIKEHVPEDITMIMVGNKSDLVDDIVINDEDIKKVADKYGFHGILTSAKTGENVNEAFLYMAYKLLESL